MNFTKPLFSEDYLPYIQDGIFTIYRDDRNGKLYKTFDKYYCIQEDKFRKPVYAIRIKLKIKEYILAS